MKFVLFSIVVFAALGYLVVNGFETRPVRDQLDSFAETAKGLVPGGLATMPDKLSHPAPDSPTGATGIVPSNREPLSSAVPETGALPPAPATVPNAPSQGTKRQERSLMGVELPPLPPLSSEPVSIPAGKTDPIVARRRAEVLGDVPAGTMRRTPKPNFMSPADRQRELDRLAEEMELTYTEKVHR